MSVIFVSYRRDDTSGHAGRLYDRLADHFGKDKIFRDVDHISYGDDFVETLEEAVGSCQALIAVIGPTWVTTKDKHGRRRLDSPHDFVRIEIESALSSGVPIFPVLVNNAEMPDTDELPESISGLARRQALEISETRVDYDVGQLLKVLEVKVGPASGADSESEPEPKPKPDFALNLIQELDKERLPPSVSRKLATLKEPVQLRFLDYYSQHKRSLSIAYLLLLLPLPILGLHNTYVANVKRQLAFWFVSGALAGLFTPAVFIWPVIDLFLLPSMVRKRNEFVARELVFGEDNERQQ